jgi:hypothetical protein
MNIQTALDNCIANLDLAVSSQETYKQGLRHFSSYLTSCAVDSLDKVTIDHFIFYPAWLKQFSKSTANVYM